MRVSIALLFFLLFPPAGVASSNIPQQVINALLKKFPQHKPNPESVKIGDLDGDGIPEAVTFLETPSKIVVLTRTKDNEYSVLILSRELTIDPRFFYFLKIEKQSLYLLTSGHGFSADYQFKMRNSDLVLIGEELRSVTPVETKELYDTGESINYLTGEAVFWSKRKTDKQYKEKRIQFTVGAPVKLKEFDFFDYKRPEQLRGY